MNGEILTPASSRWHDFLLLLTGPKYLDFHLATEDFRNNFRPESYHSQNGMYWLCHHHPDKPFARIALAELGRGEIDVAATLAQWPDLCDCGLVFNLGNEDDQMDDEWDRYEEN